jgi:hypothetical protein
MWFFPALRSDIQMKVKISLFTVRDENKASDFRVYGPTKKNKASDFRVYGPTYK